MSMKLSGGDKLGKWLAEKTAAITNSRRVDVGFFKNATYKDGTSVAAVAAAQEFGTDKIPARSFMRTTIEKNSSRWGKQAGAFLKSANYDTREALSLLGMTITGEMKSKIAEISEPPLSPHTISQKIAKKSHRPEKPLIDTGRMSDALTYQVDGSGD